MFINGNISVFLVLAFSLLIYGSVSLLNVYSLPPDPNYNTSETCGAATSNGDLTKKTCCWSERVPGKLPPNNKANYCQTCTYDNAEGTYNCNKPQQQLRPSSSGTSPDENVLEQPQTLPQGPSGPLQQGGVLENQQ